MGRWIVLLILTLGLTWAGIGLEHAEPSHRVANVSATPTIADVVAAQISNSKCFSMPQYLNSCRDAAAAARKELASVSLQWRDDDFDGLVSAVETASVSAKRKDQVMDAMLNAEPQAFDAHAFVMSAEAFAKHTGTQADTRHGIGVTLMATQAGVFVRKVLPDSPASAAGLVPFDRIVAVNGVAMGGGLLGSKNMDLLFGSEGDVLKLALAREGHHREADVKIGVLNDPNIVTAIIPYGGRRYGYVLVNRMQADACDSLTSSVEAMQARGIAGLILDLRDNPGGLVDQAVCVAGLFVGNAKVVGARNIAAAIPLKVSYYPDPASQIDWRRRLNADGPVVNLSLVAIINAGSASAAEIVAGALQDNDRAWLVGERSFGKGLLQTVQSMIGHPGFEVGFTSAALYRPSGGAIERAGIAPDFEVPAWRAASAAERSFVREADRFPTAPQPDAATPWHETRAGAADRKSCAAQRDLDSQAKAPSGPEDYQKAYALSVLDCEVVHKLPL